MVIFVVMNPEISKTTVCAVMASYIYVLSEWLFFYTMPSFMDNLGFAQNLSSLILVPLFFVALSLPLLLLAELLTLIVKQPAIQQIVRRTALLIPGFLLACTLFLMADNFTYTLFKLNVGRFVGIGRFVYAAAFVTISLWISWKIGRWITSPFWASHARQFLILAVALLSISLLTAAIAYSPSKVEAQTGAAGKTYPNILILSTDGLNAMQMSVYGYSRDTTPYIREFASSSLLFENYFTNCANSAGSIGALLTGKLPTTTRMIFPPDVYQGVDAYQSLPGILKKLGYRTAEISLRHYTDPFDMNMRDAFDMANGRSVDSLAGLVKLPAFIQHAYSPETYFLEQTLDRLTERLAHAFGIRDMINPYQVVMQMDGAKKQYPDSNRVKQILDFVQASRDPFFIHVHFMGTHGAMFDPPTTRLFSKGEEQEHAWTIDFYDDTILDYDMYVKQVVDRLKELGRFDDTMIILTTDHGMNWRTFDRLPLIIRFPGNRYTGRVPDNVQAIDIAPTILRYLGLSVPEWMEGSALIPPIKFNRYRPIVSARTGKNGSSVNGWRQMAATGPPFYSMGGVSVVVCSRWYQLNLADGGLFEKDIVGHTHPCTEQELPSPQGVLKFLLTHLQKKGYDISTIPLVRKNK